MGNKFQFEFKLKRKEPIFVFAADHKIVGNDHPAFADANLGKTLENIMDVTDAVILGPQSATKYKQLFAGNYAPDLIVRCALTTQFTYLEACPQLYEVPNVIHDAESNNASAGLLSIVLGCSPTNDMEQMRIYLDIINKADGKLPLIVEVAPQIYEQLRKGQISESEKEKTIEEIRRSIHSTVSQLWEAVPNRYALPVLIKTLEHADIKRLQYDFPDLRFGVLGGPRESDPFLAFEKTEKAIKYGAVAIIHGRNAVEDPFPRTYITAIKLVLSGSSAKDAYQFYRDKTGQ
jgi:DhnA family fructose-bisphosphate aldolase class Ia